MPVGAEIKYLIEDYVDVAVKFDDILEFYRMSDDETRKYFEECYKKVTGKSFIEKFSPLLNAESSKSVQKKRK